MRGPAWASKPRGKCEAPSFSHIRSTPSLCRSPRRTPCSCTVFRRTVAWKSLRKSSTAPSRSFSINPKTACTCRKPSCILCSSRVMFLSTSRELFFVGAAFRGGPPCLCRGAACCAPFGCNQSLERNRESTITQTEKSCTRLFRRTGHLHHHPLAQGKLWLRSYRRDRRRRPAGRLGSRPQKSARHRRIHRAR